MSDGDVCDKHGNFHAHCQRCCAEEVSTLREELSAVRDNRDYWVEREHLLAEAMRDALDIESAKTARAEIERDALRAELAATKGREARLAGLLEEVISVGEERYDMDMGESGPDVIERARAALTGKPESGGEG